MHPDVSVAEWSQVEAFTNCETVQWRRGYYHTTKTSVTVLYRERNHKAAECPPIQITHTPPKPPKTMPATERGWRHLLAILGFLATTCAALRAVNGGNNLATLIKRRVTDGQSSEQGIVRTCAGYGRLDDVTELHDEIRQCLKHPEGRTPDL